MNETNSLETQLKSWAPRRPSAKLEAALFGRPAGESRHHLSFGLMAPVAACLFLAVSLLHHPESDILPGADGSSVLTPQLASNQSSAPYFPANYQSNDAEPSTFGWTNRGASTSSNHPLSPGMTGSTEGLWTK